MPPFYAYIKENLSERSLLANWFRRGINWSALVPALGKIIK